MAGRVVLLAGKGDSTRIVYHYLESRFEDVVAVVEDPVPRLDLARRRAKRQGWFRVSGQMAFVGLAMPLLQRSGRTRVQEILRRNDLDTSEIPDVRSVDSVNSPRTIEILRELDPAVIVVNGTRIISKSVLSAVDCTFVNTHAGITPRYRGVHGGYWAIRERRRDLAGTTIHLVDPGIDTGGILAQGVFESGPKDSIATYPYLHLACGLPLLAGCVAEIVRGHIPEQVDPIDDSGESMLRWHPTLWSYLAGRLTGVR